MDDRALGTTNEIYTSGNIAPLILGAGLQAYPMATVQFPVVQRLQQNIGELGEADTSVQPPGNYIASQHAVDREMLANRAQEIERGQL